MADTELQVVAKIVATLEGAGFAVAGKGLEELDKKGKKASETLKETDSAAKQLGQSLKQYLGAAALGALVKSAITEFAKYERTLIAIGVRAEAFGESQGEARTQTDALLKSLEAATGNLRQDTAPAFNRLLGITGSLEGAFAGVSLAADLSEAGFGDVATTADYLVQIIQGRAIGAANALGLSMRDAGGHTKTASELMAELRTQYGGFASKAIDTTDSLDRAGATWNNFKQTLGQGLAPALNVVATLMDYLFRSVQSLGPALMFAAGSAGALIGSIAESLPKLFDVKALLTQGPEAWATGIKEAFTASMDYLAATSEGELEVLKEIWKRGGVESGDAMAEGIIAIDAAARKKQAEAEAEAAAEREKEAAKEREKALQADMDAAQERLQFEQRWQENAAAARVTLHADESAEKLDAEIELLAQQRDAAMGEAMARGASVQGILDAFLAEEQALRAEYAAKQLETETKATQEKYEAEQQALIDMLDAEIELLEEHDAKRLELLQLRIDAETDLEESRADKNVTATARIAAKGHAKKKRAEKDTAEAVVEIDRDSKMRQLQTQEAYAQAGVIILSQIFGRSKAIAIAEALIQTYFGAAKAYAAYAEYPPLAAAMAALAVAAGLANVNQIRKQDYSKGGGFDDPANDRLARMGGRRWAEDFVRNIDSGFRDGFAAAAGGFNPAGTVNSASTSYDQRMTLNFGHVLGGRAEARRIARVIDRARARDTGRTYR